MNIWIVAILLIGVGLAAALLVTRRGPRTAEETLGQPAAATVAPTSTARSGGQPLRLVLQSLIRNRASGMLRVSSGGQTCSIAMLFGHIYHAACGEVEGEDALRTAMNWPDATSSFDPKTRLPTKETIIRAIDAMNL